MTSPAATIEPGPSPPPSQQRERVEFSQAGDEATAYSVGRRIKTLEDLLTAAKVDTNAWRVKNWTANSWEQAANVDGEIVVTTLHQVKAFLEPNREGNWRAVLDEMRGEMRRGSPAPLPLHPVRREGGVLLEIAIPDLHFGKWAWVDETGGRYNMAEARRLFFWSIEELVAKAAHHDIERILFPVGNDFLHIDTPTATTTAGTPQDVHGTYRQLLRDGRRLAQAGIDRLAEIAPVDVVVVPGNHDSSAMYAIGEMLEDWYYNNPNVTVDNSPKTRKYYPYGRVLLGFTHGNDQRPDKLPLIMASEAREEWATAVFAEWHTGHLHTRKEFRYLPMDEFNGVRVRVIPSLCTADRWHYDKGYVAGVRSAEAYVWHRQRGLVAHYPANVLPDDSGVSKLK
jgi:hypothetical protein